MQVLNSMHILEHHKCPHMEAISNDTLTCTLMLIQLVIKKHFDVSDSDIRYCVLVSMDDRFDPHLAQAENLSALFVALNDEVFEIRELAICIIGRLSSKNPAYVMPSLRKTLIQVFTDFFFFFKILSDIEKKYFIPIELNTFMLCTDQNRVGVQWGGKKQRTSR